VIEMSKMKVREAIDFIVALNGHVFEAEDVSEIIFVTRRKCTKLGCSVAEHYAITVNGTVLNPKEAVGLLIDASIAILDTAREG
jgi:hypothetical protein